MSQKSFLDDSDRNELSEILTNERLKSAKVKVPSKSSGDSDLDEIFKHVRAASNWKGPKNPVKNKKAIKKLAGIK